MRQPLSQLTQSRFYSPAFNAAIFDGPVRIYFAQYQEALALKIYFRLQERYPKLSAAEREMPLSSANIFIMMYPTEEIFENCCAPQTGGAAATKVSQVVCEPLASDFVIGICGPLRDEEFDLVYDHVDRIALEWESLEVAPAAPIALA